MAFVLLGLMGLLWLISAVCSIITLIGAFQDEVWKGILSLLCGFYWLYFIFAEFQHEKKGLILAGIFGPTVVAFILSAISGALAVTV
jgi:hypothetical protein